MNCSSYNSSCTAVYRKTGKHSASYVCLIALTLFMIVVFITSTLFTNQWSSAFTLSLLTLLFVYLLYKHIVFIKQDDIKKIILFLVFLLFGSISYFRSRYGLARLIGLSDILMLIALFRKYPLREDEKHTVYKYFMICVFFTLLYGAVIEYLNIGSINTNTLGFLTAMALCVSFIYYIRRRILIVAIMMVVLGLLLLLVYKSRTSMLCFAMFVFLYFLLRAKRKTSKKWSVFVCVLFLSVLGILFVYLYAKVLYPRVGTGHIIIFGKDIFSGRQNIWLFAFDLLDGNLIWGAGKNIVEEQQALGLLSVYTEMHNQPLGLIVGFGLIVFILFYIVFGIFVGSFYDKKNRYNRAPAIFIAVILIVSYFEVYFFSTYTWIPIMIAFGLICGLSKNAGNEFNAKYRMHKRSQETIIITNE